MYNLRAKMIHSIHSIRVRYAETDPMKYVYYGNYATYFEIGRVELLRTIGMPYDEIENQGIWLPVSDYKIKYLKPALYDQKLEIHTYLKKIPGVRIEFEYEIYNEEGIKITEASTSLFFLDSKTGKIIKCPDYLLKLIHENWKSDDKSI